MSQKKKKHMTLIGVGLKFALISIFFTAIIITVHFLWLSHLSIPIPRIITQVLGILLLTTGALIYLISGLTIHKYFREGNLATKGTYAFFRHPLYGSWIVFIVPGIVLLINSLIGFAIPIFMYGVFKILIGEEDEYLEEKFGDEFLEYKKKVGEIFPKFRTIFRVR
jgi:protein-S-isoprenylcysteine O-methyltransferase Ste14